MPQQINLCIPILLTQKRYFSAQTMAQALAVLLVMGGGLCAYWVWSLNVASESFRKTLATQSGELERLQAALAPGKADIAPAGAAMAQDLAARQAELLQREKMVAALQTGLLRPGWGHAARLQLVAQSIPARVWVTEVTATESQLEVSGFTLEPSDLNRWVASLAASPLLEGQKLSTVKVESASAAMAKTVGAAAGSPLPAASAAIAAASAPAWSFNLVSILAKPTALAGVKR